MRFVAVGQGHRFITAPRPATLDSSIGVGSHLSGLPVAWDRIELPYGRIALRTPYGLFLSCQREAQQLPRLTLSAEMGPREAFEEILWPEGEVSLRTCELTFVSLLVETQGAEPELLCNVEETGERERFRYHELPHEVLVAVEDIVSGQPQVPDMPRQFAHTIDDLWDTPGSTTGRPE